MTPATRKDSRSASGCPGSRVQLRLQQPGRRVIATTRRRNGLAWRSESRTVRSMAARTLRLGRYRAFDNLYRTSSITGS